MTNSTRGNGYQFSDKWSDEVGIYNFTQVPNLLLYCQGHLDLSDGELITLIHLMTFWFHSDSKIFPTIKKLAGFSGNSVATVQKRLKRLDDKGFIRRINRMGTSNTYDVTPSIEVLSFHQQECTTKHRKQPYAVLISEVYPTSKPTNKEDQLTKLNNKTENMDHLSIDMIPDEFLEWLS